MGCPCASPRRAAAHPTARVSLQVVRQAVGKRLSRGGGFAEAAAGGARLPAQGHAEGCDSDGRTGNRCEGLYAAELMEAAASVRPAALRGRAALAYAPGQMAWDQLVGLDTPKAMLKVVPPPLPLITPPPSWRCL